MVNYRKILYEGIFGRWRVIHPSYRLRCSQRKLGIPAENIVKLDANENPYGPVPEGS